MQNVVVVESPAKATTINRYLGKDYTVLASYGHVRDLLAKDGSVLPDQDFAMSWEVSADGGKRLSAIAKALKGAGRLVLATDPDREGEAIAWHVLETLEQKGALAGVEIERVAFNAVTRAAVLEAMENPRKLDQELVDAYLARRALDYLVGFKLSPVLWRKLPGAKSAGRVQSVALRLICERESEREAFMPREYWTVEADLRQDGQSFTARLVELDGRKLDKFSLGNEAAARQAEEAVGAASWRVAAVERKPVSRRPAPPFTTSTLQQEASRKLGFGARRTMQAAQRLYEGSALDKDGDGLITYMRTDGVQITPEALERIRKAIGEHFGADYLPPKPWLYKSRARNAQEAHEAIRPTDLARTPQSLSGKLAKDEARLYELIWKRALASQMNPAKIERTSVELRAGNAEGLALRATGSRIVFDGFLKLYREDSDDPSGDEKEQILPGLKTGQTPALEEARSAQHFTQPPPRFTEASLVRRLEELGIGRPSTYAPIISLLGQRGYVNTLERRLVPDSRGRLVTAFLETWFGRYVEYDFSASLEEELDKISAGKIAWRKVLADFWRGFSGNVAETAELRVTEVLDRLNEALAPFAFPPPEDGGDPRACSSCAEGRLSIKTGRYGAFVGCSNYPACRFTRPLSGESPQGAAEERVIGKDENGVDLLLKTGRFGPYVERAGAEGEKPRRVSLPKGFDPGALDLEKARFLISLPREIGKHPETRKAIRAGIGRFGPYVVHDGIYAGLGGGEDLFEIGLNRAVSLLAEKKAKGRRKKAGGRKTGPSRRRRAS